MKGFTVNKSSSKGVIVALIIAVVGALAAAWYFLWYVPHTPAYTLKIIHQAVQEKNADEVLRHVDVKSIVKNIVDMHGGTITVKSDLNGTVFTVTLQVDFDVDKEHFGEL